MGKRSTKENKTIYQLYREEAGFTRAKASEQLEYISESRIEKIESEKTAPHPEEILAMADAYKKPDLCNHYCSQVCPIGQEYVPAIEVKELSQITLEMLSTLNTLAKEKERLIEIVVDGKISPDEMKDFVAISENLEDMSLAIESLKLWVKNSIAAGEINPKQLSL